MKNGVRTGYLSEQEYDAWNRMVLQSPQGSIYSLPEYLDILCSVAGGQFRLLSCFKGDEIVGGIALYETERRFGKLVSNRLLLYYNGIVLKAQNSSYPSQRTSKDIEIMSALESELSSCDYSRIVLHNRSPLNDIRPFLSKGWEAWPSYTYVVPVSDYDATWARVEQNQKRLVKRCESNGVVLSEDDDFDSFYRMHVETHKRKGAPLYLPRDAFRTYFEKLSSLGMCRLFHARMPDGRSIAAQLVLMCGHPVTHTVTAAADGEYLKLGSTPFLRVKVFERLAALGYEANDLTDADLNPVTRFKSQLGGDLEMTLVLRKTYSVGLRVQESLSRSYFRARSIAGKIIKPILGRKRDE